MWDTPIRIVKPHDGPVSYGRAVRTLDPDKGAVVQPGEILVEFQPTNSDETTDGGKREHVATTWRIVTRPGEMLPGLESTDGVIVDGIDGVLEVIGDVARVIHPRLGHAEVVVRRWVG